MIIKKENYLSKKERKNYKKSIIEKLNEFGIKDQHIVSKTNKIRTQISKNEEGQWVQQRVNMVEIKNLHKNLLRKILKYPKDEVDAFLALDAEEFRKNISNNKK